MNERAGRTGDAVPHRSGGADPGGDDSSPTTAEGVRPAVARPAADRTTDRAASRAAYFYAVLRLVPNVERDERFNVGVVLFSRSLRFIGLRTALDPRKLTALAPGRDPEPLARQLAALAAVADGAAEGGPIARLDPAERFHWLAAPSSTMIQPSPVHTGLTADPAATLDRLFEALVTG